MRILLANEARAGGGGVETYLASLVAGLEARGHQTALLYANSAQDEGPTRIATRDAWSVTDLGLERAAAGARAWRPDVCFSHNMRLLEVDEGLAAEWPTFKMMHGYFGACVSGHKAFSFPSLQPCPRICGPGCLVYFLPRRCGQLRPDVMAAQYGWARRQQRLFGRYAGVVVASDHMRGEYLRYHLPEQRVHTIPLFAASAERGSMAADAAITRAERGAGVPASERVWGFGGQSPPNEIDVLFLGRMTPLKGPRTLLQAVRHAARSLGRPLHVVLAGEGPERHDLERLAQESRGSVMASFPGWVDESARAALLSRASLVAIPSIWPEPFGLVGLEAAQFGVPAVAFDVGGIREWLAHEVNGRLADLGGGPAALGDAIAGVLADDALRLRLSAGALDASRHFSADAHMARLEQLFFGSGGGLENSAPQTKRTSGASEPRERRGALGVLAPRRSSGRPEPGSKGASERVGGAGPPSPRSGFGEVSPEPANPRTRAEADGAKPPGEKMLWHVVTGEYPPECGGVGDYTATLAQGLAAAGDTVHVWTFRAPGAAELARHDGVVVHELPDRFAARSREALSRAWRETPGTVLLQYVPNALGSRGLNLRFCLWLRKMHRAGADVRVMFHEPYFYFSIARPWRNAIAIVQRTMAATLLQAASRVYMSTETWYRYLRAVGVLPPFQALPIPSSIPEAALPAAIQRFRSEIAPAGGAVVGHFGTFGEHVAGELLAVLPSIASRVTDARFALVGAGSREFLEHLRREHPDLATRMWASGRLDPSDVAAVLRACDVMIQPYPDGVTTRRTSAMAGLKNGVATVSTNGFLTEPIWSRANAVALPATGDHAAFGDAVAALLRDPRARASLASRGAETYRRHFSIEQTVAALRGAPAGAA